MLAYQDVTENEIVTLDNEVHGRLNAKKKIDVSTLVGWLTDMEVIAISGRGLTLKERVFQAIYKLFQGKGVNSDYWFEPASDNLTHSRDIQFNYFGQDSSEFVEGGLELWGVDSGADIGDDFPLLYQCIVTAKLKHGQLLSVFDYNSYSFSGSEMERFVELVFDYTDQISSFLEQNQYDVKLLIAQSKSQLPEYLNIQYNNPYVYVPTTLMQQSIYIDCEVSTKVDLYVTQTLLTFAGALDLNRLEIAWNKVVSSFSLLKASFKLDDSEGLFQAIDERRKLKVEDSRDDDRTVIEIKAKEKELGFDLNQDLLIRLRLVKNEYLQEQLIVTHHHILLDGWSFGIVLNDVMQAYQDDRFERSNQNNFAYFEWLSKYEQSSATAYWVSQLANLESATLLQRVNREGGLIESKSVFSLEDTAAISNFCQQKGFSLNQYLQSVWGYLLSKLTHQNAVSFGQVVNGRHPDLEGSQSMVGLFINTLPKVVQVSSTDEVESFISRVQDPAQISAEFLSLSAIQKLAPHIEGELFDSLFVFENYPVELTKDSRSVSELQLVNIQGDEATGFPVTIVISPGEQLQVKLQLNGQIGMSAQSLLVSFKYIASQFADSLLLADVSLSPESELKQLEEWNNTSKVFPAGTMVDVLSSHITSPNSIALSDGSKQLTYSEFNQLTCQWGHLLQKRGVMPNCLVALYLPRSIDMVLALHGVWQAGGAYLPLDITNPQKRIADILADAAPTCVITTKELASDLPINTNLILLDDLEIIAEREAASTCAPVVARQGEDTAYVIYTSGSTGIPKGVMVSHRALVNRIDWMQKQYPLTNEDVVIQKTPYTFDVSVWELVWPFYSGAKLSVAKAEGHRDPSYLSEFMVSEGVSVMHFVPSMLTAMLEHGGLGQAKRLRYVFASGEALLSSTVSAFYSSGSSASLHNLYGPTEAAIDVSFWDCSAQEGEQVPIGKPIQNITLHVLDDDLRPLPIGAIGELYIGGVGLAKGYINQEELTAERFIISPLSQERLYKTGDLAHWRADGQLMYVGRSDFQVKLRGLRIELGEIEAKLLSIPGIRESAVTVQSEQLVAYYTGEVSAVSGIEQLLKEQLPSYMVPTHYVALASMPLSANGKLARNALPAVDVSSSEVDYEAPVGELEVLVAAVWQQVLGIEKVSRLDNFFSLGGDSLLVLKVLALLRRETKQDIPLSVLLMHGVLSDQVRDIQQSNVTREILFESVSDKQLVPLTQAQQRIWLLQELAPTNSQFHMARVLKLTGKVDREQITAALRSVQFQHGALRTKLVSYDQQVWQQQGEVHFELIDVSEIVSSENIEEGVKLLIEAPFNLMVEYPIKAYILSINENESILIFVVHHMFCDGLSMEIIANSFEQYYKHGVTKLERSKELHYIDYANYQNKHNQNNEDNEAWWRQYLEGAPECHELVLNGQRTAELSMSGGNLSYVLTGEQVLHIRKMTKSLGISIFHLFHGLMSILVGQYSGNTDVLIGSPMANREHSQTQNIVGLFLNTFVVRHQKEESCTIAEWLKQTAENCMNAMNHGSLGFERIVEVINPPRGHYSPLFQIFINHIRTSTVQQQGSGRDFSINEIQFDQETAKYELSLYCLEQEDKLELVINYKTALFNHSTIEGYMQSLCSLLNIALESQELSVANLSLSSENFLAIKEGAKYSLPYDNMCDCFLANAEQYRDCFAITCENERLTYSQLVERVMQFSLSINHYPKEINRVMIFSERNIDFLSLILACWHLGIVVIPVDADMPEQRAKHIYEDCDADLVLVQNESCTFVETSKQLTIKKLLSSKPSLETVLVPNSRENNCVAYIIYTSGSTGKPKGVCGTHLGLINRIQWMQRSYPYTSNTAVQITQTGFIRHLWETFLPLLSGKHVTLMGSNYYQDPASFFSSLKEVGCDRIVTTPTVLQSFSQYVKESGDSLDIDLWFVSGESFSSSIASEAHEQFKQTQFINLYGSTEVTSDVSSHHIERNIDHSTISLGDCIDNTSIMIVDHHGQVLPKMARGQIAISGCSLAKGYWRVLPENNDAFITLSDSEIPIYLTGDFGYIDMDNELKLVGRMDEQVNIGGYRCELNEIRHAMMKLEQVDDVSIQITAENDPYIAAYVASTTLARLSAVELTEYLLHAKRVLNDWLPYYMLPKSIQIMANLPLTANGKVDRDALHNWYFQHGEELLAETETETMLADLIGKMLAISHVDMAKNFFELGGTSIKASQLRNQLLQRLDIDLPLKVLFGVPTIGSLAKEIENKLKEQQLIGQMAAVELDTEDEEFII